VILADAHLHLFRHGFPGVYGRNLFSSEIDVYEAFRAKHGIAAGLIVGYQGGGIDPDNNAYIRELAATRPWMATLAYVEAGAMPSAATIEDLLAAGHAGLAVYVMDDAAADALSRWDAAAWRALDAHGAIVSFNIGLPRVAVLARIAAAAPRCRLIVSHMGLPGVHAETPGRDATRAELATLLALAPYRNVYVKLSGFYAVSDPSHAWPHVAAAPFVEALVDGFGTDRCLWASDFSPALDHVSFIQTITVPGLDGFDAATRAAVMGGNLLRLLGRNA
jgi:predicted TIM-barrel fold metal-dependent hydrolase